jgi:hypothetical protein
MKDRSRLVPHSLRSLALGVAVCLPLLTATGRASAEDPPAKEQPSGKARKAILLGSSSMNDAFGHLIASDLKDKGFEVMRKGVPAAGFSRPDFRDMREVVKGLPFGAETDLVVVYLGMNDAQAMWLRPEERKGKDAWVKWNEDRWAEIYEKRAKELFSAICERGAKKAVVLLPVDVMSAGMQRKLERIRGLQKKAAESARCATPVSTGGDVGNFMVGGAPTRAKDGIHMSPRGAQVIWDRIKRQVLPHAGA